MPTKLYYKACDALINGNWIRSVVSNGEKRVGSYSVHYPEAPNCLCALGVIEQQLEGIASPISNKSISLMGISERLLEAAEDLYEGWSSYEYEKWSHKQVGEWLLKVGKAIDNRPNRIKQLEDRKNYDSFLKAMSSMQNAPVADRELAHSV